MYYSVILFTLKYFDLFSQITENNQYSQKYKHCNIFYWIFTWKNFGHSLFRTGEVIRKIFAMLEIDSVEQKLERYSRPDLDSALTELLENSGLNKPSLNI